MLSIFQVKGIMSEGGRHCGAGFGGVGRAGAIKAVIGRRTGGVYFFIVAIAVAVDDDDGKPSIGNEGLSRLTGPGRFSVSQEEADRCTP